MHFVPALWVKSNEKPARDDAMHCAMEKAKNFIEINNDKMNRK